MSDNVLSSAQSEYRLGLTAGLSAYLLWGFLPVYYKLTGSVPAYLVVSHRVVWSVVSVGLFLLAVGRMGEVRAIFANRSHLMRLLMSATFISINWLVFIWAIEVNRVLEVSFGYFINPLVSILIGMAVLGERLTRAQTAAAFLMFAAIALQGIWLGALPWVSLVLAITFAIYGYLRKTIPVGATPGLFIETVMISPLAVAFMVYLQSRGDTVMPTDDPGLTVALIGTGVVTALPLILFATGARRLPLSLMGFMQYIAPSIHLVLAVMVWGEVLSPVKLFSFVMIWISLLIVTVDTLRKRR